MNGIVKILLMEGPKNAFRNNHSLRVKKRRSTMGKKSTLPTVSLVLVLFYLLLNDAMLLLLNDAMLLFMNSKKKSRHERLS